MSEIRAWERRHGEPATVSDTLAAWRAMAARTRRELDAADRRGIGCGEPGCCPQQDDIRSRLDEALHALSPHSRRELHALVTGLDDRVESQLLPDPGPPPHLVTWSRR